MSASRRFSIDIIFSYMLPIRFIFLCFLTWGFRSLLRGTFLLTPFGVHIFFAKRQGCLPDIVDISNVLAEVRADVRIRIRGNVRRVRIGETCIRTVIRITAEQKPTRKTNLIFYSK